MASSTCNPRRKVRLPVSVSGVVGSETFTGWTIRLVGGRRIGKNFLIDNANRSLPEIKLFGEFCGVDRPLKP